MKRISGALICLLLVTTWVGCSQNKNPQAPESDSGLPAALPTEGMALGPIEGLSYGWHPIDNNVTLPIPLGTPIRISCGMPAGSVAISWTGAEEISRSSLLSIAEINSQTTGSYEIVARLDHQDGRVEYSRCTLKVINIDVADIKVGPVVLGAEAVDLDEFSNNEQTMHYYFGSSVAAVTETAPGSFLSSSDRELRLSVGVTPALFAPVIEWRENGEPLGLGAEISYMTGEPGLYRLSAGYGLESGGVELETYRALITSHEPGVDEIPDGEWITFSAVTEPAGFEEHITWLSSTKFGTAAPVLGRGPVFTARFEDTWGPHPQTGMPFRWLGVKADQFVLGRDDNEELMIDSFSPTLLVEDELMTIIGNGFPMDAADSDIQFALDDDTAVTLYEVEVFDTDDDGFGEMITGSVGPISDLLTGALLALELQTGEGEILDNPAGDGDGVFFWWDATNPLANGPFLAQAAVVASSNTINGSYDEDAEAMTFDFTNEPAWDANSNYGVKGGITIKYKLGTSNKSFRLSSTNYVRFTTDGTPSLQECLDKLVEIYQAILDSATGINGLNARNNFEVVRNGDMIEVKKKDASTVTNVKMTKGSMKYKEDPPFPGQG